MFVDWQPNEVIANGSRFNFYRTPGAAGKPVLVLQHGASDNGLCWAPVAQELAQAYDCLMPDARGHGRSARLTPGQEVDQAADLAAVLRAVNVDRAVVAGHSMGAQIAADLAARFPDLVRGIVLEDPPWRSPAVEASSQPPAKLWFVNQQAMSLEQSMAECRQEHPTWQEPYVQAWCQGKHEYDLNALALMGRPSHWQERVPKIQCPTLLITADPALGAIVTPELAAQVQALNPKFRVADFPGVGHHIRFARHEAYMQTFNAFLREVA